MSLNLAETKQIGTGLAERILKYVNSPSYLQDLMSGYCLDATSKETLERSILQKLLTENIQWQETPAKRAGRALREELKAIREFQKSEKEQVQENAFQGQHEVSP